jgi:hypothetical protein
MGSPMQFPNCLVQEQQVQEQHHRTWLLLQVSSLPRSTPTSNTIIISTVPDENIKTHSCLDFLFSVHDVFGFPV